MKRVFIILVLCVTYFGWVSTYAATDCVYDDTGVSISDNLDKCLKWSSLVKGDDAAVESWFRENINTWTGALATFLWIFAVWSIVYGGLLMTLSTWDDEKIKKAKDVVKWWMIGFVCVIWASALILLVVNIMFSIWG
jgi:hypothetical protein